MLYNRYSHMVQEYYVNRLRTIMDERKKRISSLKTKKDAEKYVEYVRRAVKKSFGPMPPRTPLKTQTTGTDEYKNYFLEKILYESRPGFPVSANFYLPKNFKPGKTPGVLGLCGHSPAGKAEPAYQSYCQGLANKGFAVLVIDPISQGERWQHHKPKNGEMPGLCVAHNLMGNQMILVDDYFGKWRVWDAIRGLDYLCSRPEIDLTRVGVTGNSGGGTLTTFVTSLDPRPTMAAPSCYICSWLANLENEIPADAEQNPPGILADGLDEADMLLCYAPRPTIILSKQNDFFDERYARQAYEDLKKVHHLLGSDSSVGYFAGPGDHGYTIENREAMYKFFVKQAGLKCSGKEIGVKPVEPEKLFVTSTGNVNKPSNRRVFDFTREKSELLAKKRKKCSYGELVKKAEKLLKIPKKRNVPHYRILPSWYTEEFPCQIRGVFAVDSEPGIQTLAMSFGPAHPNMHFPKGEVQLYLGHTDSLKDIVEIPKVKQLAKGKKPFIAVDPRGIGQSLAKTCGMNDFFYAYGSDYLYASTGEMLNENYLSRRVLDVLSVMDLMMSKGAKKFTLIGRGLGALTATFAALLHPSKPKIEIFNYLTSYQSLIDAEVYTWPLSAMPGPVLKYFDLPDIYKAFGKRLTTSKPWKCVF